MSSDIVCFKLKKKGKRLEELSYPGDLGQRIMDSICQEAWQMWLDRQTMIINENRLDPLSPDDRQQLESHMQGFLFGESEDGAAGQLPGGYTEK